MHSAACVVLICVGVRLQGRGSARGSLPAAHFPPQVSPGPYLVFSFLVRPPRLITGRWSKPPIASRALGLKPSRDQRSVRRARRPGVQGVGLRTHRCLGRRAVGGKAGRGGPKAAPAPTQNRPPALRRGGCGVVAPGVVGAASAKTLRRGEGRVGGTAVAHRPPQRGGPHSVLSRESRTV